MADAKRKIVLEATYPHPVADVWRALTDKRALSQWLMKTEDFEPVVGRKFQLHAKPMKGWRGYVDAQVLEVVKEKRVSYSWQGMPEHHVMTVSWDLAPAAGGTRVTLTHDGFDGTHGFMSGLFLRAMLKAGWKRMLRKLLPLAIAGGVTEEQRAAACRHQA